MSNDHLFWMQIGRLLFAGVGFCTLLVLTGEFALAHGGDVSDTSPSQSNQPNSFSPSSPETAGLQAASWILTVPYGAAKMAYAIGGGIVGGLAWAMTGGNMEVATSIWMPSMTGDYIVQPQHLTGEKHLYFVGVSTEEPL